MERRRLPVHWVLLWLLPAAAAAQTTGNIKGRVTDSSGAGLPGVAVEASGANLQGVRRGTSDREGRFRFPALPPGPYTVRAELPGFRPAERAAMVGLDATATAELVLEPSLEERVAVTGEAPRVDTTSTTTGTSYTSDVIDRLPVARNYAEIVRANPGVLPDRGQTQGRSIALSIYGSTSVEHQWIIDGVNTTNVLKGMQGKAINNEFVQEVEVKTGGYQAEYGRALGGVINVITKSGGNQFHGDGFLYYDSTPLQAERVFQEGTDSGLIGMRVANYERFDYGADLGGYLLKDRLWFFAAYDRIAFRSNLSRYESSLLVPSTMTFPLDGTDNLYSVKVTWNPSPATTLVATVFGDPTTDEGAATADPRQGEAVNAVTFFNPAKPITNPDPGTWESNRSIGGTDYGLRLHQLFGAVSLVTLQASRHQDRYRLLPTGPGLQPRVEDLLCDGGTPDRPCQAPQEPNFVTGGLGFVQGGTNRSESRRDQIRGDATAYLASHEIKLGGDYQEGRTTATNYFSGGQLVRHLNEYGQTYYEHDFYAASPEDLTPTDAESHSKVRDYGAFLQDSWRPAPGLTVNAGLRLDRELVFNATEAVIRTTTWQPRLGVVWDPNRDGKTKVYAFAGRFSYGLPTDLAILAYGGYTSAVTYNFDAESVRQDRSVFQHGDASVFPNEFGEPVDSGLKGISQDELTIGVEKLFGSSFTLGLKGTYRRLAHAIEDRCDLDYNKPENNSSNCGFMNPGSSGTIASGDFFYCNGLDSSYNNCVAGEALRGAPPTPAARRLYRGIELLARKEIGSRLWFQASYVYSSLRGNYDGEVSETYGQTDPGLNQDFDYPQLFHNSYGRLYLDRPHQVRFDGFYRTPFGLSIGLQAWLRSGAPLSRLGYLNDYFFPYSPIQLDSKGYTGRLPMEWDANLVLAFPIQVGPVTVTPQAYLYNVFDNQIRTGQDTIWSNQAQDGYPDPASIYDPNQKQTNANYGKVTARQDPRLFRAALRISF